MNFSYQLRTTFFALFILMGCANFAQSTFTMSSIGGDNFLNNAWDLNYGPDGYLWVTERVDGKVIRIDPDNAAKDELIDIAEVYSDAGQDGLLGMTFHDDFLTDKPYVYLSYTYLVSTNRRQKIVRYTYSVIDNNGSLSSPITLIDGIPSSDDHNSGRLIFSSDDTLYYTIGDQGEDNCANNLAQYLPTQLEIDNKDWSDYPGKVLRLNLDGSIPENNPVIEGVKSHIYSYGHRNAQGIVIGANGLIYSDEHGPSSDDEVNIITAGQNYGWPYVAGVKDDLVYSNDGCHDQETSFTASNYQDPLMSIFTPNHFGDRVCADVWQCRPNIAPSSLDIYESNAIPAWKNSLLISSLKKGRVYRLKLDEAGTAVEGDITELFYTQNRYRDIVVHPNGNIIYILTDASGKTSDAAGTSRVTDIDNPGTILKFTLDQPLSVANNEVETIFKVWPNPASDKLNIEVKVHGESNYRAELINSMGQVVKEYVELQSGINELNIDGYSNGVYILKLYSKEGSSNKRVVLY